MKNRRPKDWQNPFPKEIKELYWEGINPDWVNFEAGADEMYQAMVDEGWQSPEEIREGKEKVREAFRLPRRSL